MVIPIFKDTGTGGSFFASGGEPLAVPAVGVPGKTRELPDGIVGNEPEPAMISLINRSFCIF
jgi:hypothetical protein